MYLGNLTHKVYPKNVIVIVTYSNSNYFIVIATYTAKL